MGWLLILAGAALVALALRRGGPVQGAADWPVFQPVEVKETAGTAPAGPEELAALRAEVDELAETVAELALRLQTLEARPAAVSRAAGWRPAHFEEALQSSQRQDLHEAIWQAHAEGKDVTEIARQFGRGKGEVELILNLRR